ncbi:LamG-like jellyroll fold domain-containing protein [Streptomyces sp. NPDC001500]
MTDTATHWWQLAEGATGTDSTGTLGAALSGAYTWGADTIRGKFLSLNGTTGYGTTTTPAVDTSKSFTASAWVKLNSLSVNSTFVSQNGTTDNGFQLYYSSGAQGWAFGRWSTDASGSVWRAAYGSKATTDQWTHLVGVYGEYANASISGIRVYPTALPPPTPQPPATAPRWRSSTDPTVNARPRARPGSTGAGPPHATASAEAVPREEQHPAERRLAVTGEDGGASGQWRYLRPHSVPNFAFGVWFRLLLGSKPTRLRRSDQCGHCTWGHRWTHEQRIQSVQAKLTIRHPK